MSITEPWGHTSPAQQVVVGAGVVDALPDVLKALGVRRALVVTTSGREGSELGRAVLVRLGRNLAATATIVEPSVPAPTVQRGVADLRAEGADGLVALGGGAAVDTAKALAFFAEQEAGTPAAGFADRPVLPIVAVPTTLVGAAFTPHFAMLDPNTRRVAVAGGPTTVPSAVVADLDALATLDPDELSASAIAALGNAVDVVLAAEGDPEGRALAVGAVAPLLAGFDQLAEHPGPASASLLDGSVLAGRSLQSSPDGLLRALVRLVSARTGAPFGRVHAALLVPVVRVLAEVIDEARLAPLCSAVGAGSGDELAEALGDLLARVGAESRLADLDVSDDDLDAVARQSASQRGVQRAVRPLGEIDVRALLDDAS